MRPAETLLVELGVTRPEDIDVDAIAYCVGAEIYYRDLLGCEAEIIGRRDRAIIHVQKDARPRRKRFSAGHELGHWHHHKGQSFICRPEDISFKIDENSRNAERLADSYSADLLLPPFLFGPKIESEARITLGLLREVSDAFDASLTSTAIRAMRMTKQPLILIGHDLAGRRWQWPSITATNLRIRDDIDVRSSAFTVVSSSKPVVTPLRKEPANYWFDRRHIEQFDVQVESIRTHDGEALTLLRIPDGKLIDIYG